MPFYCRRAAVLKSSAVICSVARPLLPLRIGGPAKAQYVHTRTHTVSHYHISNPLHAPSGVYWKLQFIHCLLMGGGAWQQPPRLKE